MSSNPLSILYRTAKDVIVNRDMYESIADSLTIAKLRLSATNKGAELFGHGVSEVSLKSYNSPVTLRSGSHDVFALKEVIEQEEYKRVSDWEIPEDAKIIDLGSNIGMSILYFDKKYPKAKFIAVEPDKDNYRILSTNTRFLRDQDRIKYLNGFISNEDGEAAIDRTNGAMGFKKAEVGEGTESIPCFSMERLFNDFNHETYHILKADIEGSEKDLFRTCKSWIHKIKYLIVETHAPYTSQLLIADIKANGVNIKTHHIGKNQAQGTAICYLEVL